LTCPHDSIEAAKSCPIHSQETVTKNDPSRCIIVREGGIGLRAEDSSGERRGEASDPFQGNREFLERFRRGDRIALDRVYWFYVDGVERLVLLIRLLKVRFLPRLSACAGIL